jgi:nucleoside-diphosphate-sugar epimerase
MIPILIAGCGYLGQRLARLHQSAGHPVHCLVRSAQSRTTLVEAGLEADLLDLDQALQGELTAFRHGQIYYLIPPPKDGDTDPRVGRLIAGFCQDHPPRRVVYLSTTGVYGDCGGDWIDEQRPTRAVAPRALRRLSAEQQWRRWASETGGDLVVLRVAGIYGPGRLPLERLRQSAPMLCAEQAPYSNRIHVDDLAQVCLAALRRGRPGEVYNVSDGHPSTMLDYFNRIADLSGLPRPPQLERSQAQQQLSPEMMSYMEESRRLSNAKMLRELGVRLRYPTLAEGLPACFAKTPG